MILMFEGRKRTHQAKRFTTEIAAKKVREPLLCGGYGVTKGPDTPDHATSFSNGFPSVVVPQVFEIASLGGQDKIADTVCSGSSHILESVMTEPGPLTALAVKYDCDKWGSHRYTPIYERYFCPFRDKPISLLELGVGGYADPSAGGASLKMWADYFTAAKIFAVDIEEKSQHETQRIKIYQGSQTDKDLLHRIHDDAGGFDIIIDDGSHVSEHVIASFNILFPLLRKGGIYVVEDTQTSYWPYYGGSTVDKDATTTTMGFFKSLIHGVNHVEFARPGNIPSYLDTAVFSIHFYHNLIIVYKDDNMEPSNIPPDDPTRAA
jgi:hypothetical protein